MRGTVLAALDVGVNQCRAFERVFGTGVAQTGVADVHFHLLDTKLHTAARAGVLLSYDDPQPAAAGTESNGAPIHVPPVAVAWCAVREPAPGSPLTAVVLVVAHRANLHPRAVFVVSVVHAAISPMSDLCNFRTAGRFDCVEVQRVIDHVIERDPVCATESSVGYRFEQASGHVAHVYAGRPASDATHFDDSADRVTRGRGFRQHRCEPAVLQERLQSRHYLCRCVPSFLQLDLKRHLGRLL